MNILERRVERLGRTNRRLTMGVFLLGVVLAAGFFFPGTRSAPKPIEDVADTKAEDIVAPRVITRELIVVDDSGKTVATLHTRGKPGFAYLELWNGKDKSHVELGSYGLRCLNGMNKSRVSVTGGDFESSGVDVKDEKGNTHLALCQSFGEPVMFFVDSNDRERIQMGVRGENAIINYKSDPAGREYSQLIPQR